MQPCDTRLQLEVWELTHLFQYIDIEIDTGMSTQACIFAYVSVYMYVYTHTHTLQLRLLRGA